MGLSRAVVEMGNPFLKAGKLDPDFLAALLRRNVIRDRRVLVGPGVGLDVAVIDCGETCLVAKTDPVTFATDAIGCERISNCMALGPLSERCTQNKCELVQATKPPKERDCM